jgi:hypothetical protein
MAELRADRRRQATSQLHGVAASYFAQECAAAEAARVDSFRIAPPKHSLKLNFWTFAD